MEILDREPIKKINKLYDILAFQYIQFLSLCINLNKHNINQID